MTNFWSHVTHFVAGAVVVAFPLFIANIPLSWQAMTIGGILVLLLNMAKSYLAA